MRGAPEREAFIKPPARMPPYLRLGIWLAERVAQQPLLPGRLLAWYPPAAVSSGVLEALIAKGDATLTPRLLNLVRLQTSLAVSCPFCIQMNSAELEKNGVTPEEMSALRGQVPLAAVPSLTVRERLALEYARLISASPLLFPPAFVTELTANFAQREMVILASTAAQVNYWARLIQALGIPVPGQADECALPATAGARG
jgi:AhpD family alkylhydroperoxidase